ncbi:MAG TPA: hypothetical protein VGW40_05825 [Allosphingosinicella sp.]|nr:hypothetical protein [Allosphingosinicella sp.]
MTAAPDRFETVAFVYSPSDLALLLSLFESEDIFVFTVGRWHASADPPLTTALGGVELRVHAAEAEDARLVLASLPPIPCRAPLARFIPLAALMVLLFLVMLVPPPRQIPTFVLRGAVAARRAPVA